MKLTITPIATDDNKIVQYKMSLLAAPVEKLKNLWKYHAKKLIFPKTVMT